MVMKSRGHQAAKYRSGPPYMSGKSWSPDHGSALVTVIVTKTPSNKLDMLRQGETTRRCRLRPA
jgi:hypothetical protein